MEVMSDNSPFSSTEFREFASKWEFKHTTSSPRYPQSNGRVERAVSVAKKLMIKAQETNTDPYLALLDYRNTPSEQLGLSPVQLMFGRRTRTLLPTAESLLDSPSFAAASQSLSQAKHKQAFYYNRHAKPRPALKKGDTVRVRYDDRPDWRLAQVDKVLPHRSYEVRFPDGTTRRRTSKHVRFSPETKIEIFDDDDPPNTQPLSPSNVPQTERQSRPSNYTTRSGRIVRRPARYND